MSLREELLTRAESKCELCETTQDLLVFTVPPEDDSSAQTSALICQVCKDQIEGKSELSPDHWHCLKNTMWSGFAPVQVLIWRTLTKLSNQSWAQDLLSQLYIEDEILAWAKTSEEESLTVKDSNGALLQDGDSVTLIKDLVVKGGGFTAKRGTLVKNISLTANPEHIEGRVNGVHIVLVTNYLKKVIA